MSSPPDRIEARAKRIQRLADTEAWSADDEARVLTEDVLALVNVAKAAEQSVAKLSGCLWDERAWEGEELVALMEYVNVLLGEALAALGKEPA